MGSSEAIKVALVTGAGVRVGRAIAAALADSGWRVFAHYNASKPDKRHDAVQSDLSTEAGIRQLSAAVKSKTRRLDLLVNSAAIFERLPLAKIDAARFDAQMALNARAPLLLARELAALLKRANGSIVNIADVGGGLVPWAGYAHYCASKAALARITECLALELAPDIRVNAVAPGAVMWPESYSAAERRRLAARIPLRRSGSADDIAEAVRFLSQAPFVTGVILPVDGGRHLAGRG